ncbi:hypothetical protein [Luteipulveratus flavus]|uniref:Uncharacterized protein n=1 Tax=Luteipulveratus flavus TaxID=3031728 RepID=A0ABT6CA35_9MICO|nr:hypothetical protein [Luteipulveratus sp. YIM 133296]MDF8265378.1 hypothetical protein [Luteipulveratus sp. YIM 133296]
MKITDEQLRASLDTLADAAVEVPAGDTVAGVRHKVSRHRHERGALIAAACTIAVLALTIWTIGLRSPQPPTMPATPVPPLPSQVHRSASVPPSLAAEARAANLPLHLDGLVLKEVRTVPTRASAATSFDWPAGYGDQVALALACTQQQRSARAATKVYDNRGQEVHPDGLTCFDPALAGNFGADLTVAMPPTGSRSVRMVPDRRVGSSVRVGVYSFVPWDQFPMDRVPSLTRTTELSGPGVSAEVHRGTEPVTIRARVYANGGTLTLDAPRGRFRIEVNGHVIDPCPGPEPSTRCQGDLLTFWQPTKGAALSVVQAPSMEGQDLAVRVVPIGVQGTWRVGLDAGTRS